MPADTAQHRRSNVLMDLESTWFSQAANVPYPRKLAPMFVRNVVVRIVRSGTEETEPA